MTRVLHEQIVAIINVETHSTQRTVTEHNNFTTLRNNFEQIKTSYAIERTVYGAPTLNQKSIVAELQANQRENVRKKTFTFLTWGVAAVGMTLIAVAPFCGPAAPALLLAGTIVGATSGAMKLGEVLLPRIANYLSKLYYTNQLLGDRRYSNTYFLDSLLEEIQPGLSKIPSFTKIKLTLAYELACKNNPNIDKREFYTSLFINFNAITRNKILNNALQMYIDEKILGDLHIDNANTLSEGQKTQIINRECRNKTMRNAIGFFKQIYQTPGPAFCENPPTLPAIKF